MQYSIGPKAFWIGLYTLVSLIAFSSCVRKWQMHEHCNQQIGGYGGEIFFDARKLPPHVGTCRVTLVGNGSLNAMLSLYFTSFNVSDGCPGNITLKETLETGLSESFCAANPYLNEYLIYTTVGRVLTLTFTRKAANKPTGMSFHIKFVTYVARVRGCTKDEVNHQNMFSCTSGRCVHESVVCKDLNPCGDQMDCAGDHAQEAEEGGGMGFFPALGIVVGTVIIVFIIIQASLTLRNNSQGMCASQEPKPTIEAEFYSAPIEDPDYKVNSRDTNRNGATNQSAAYQSLLHKETV